MLASRRHAIYADFGKPAKHAFGFGIIFTISCVISEYIFNKLGFSCAAEELL